MGDSLFRNVQTLPAVTATQAPAAPARLGTSAIFSGGLLVQADPTNGGYVYVGATDVVTTTGVALAPGAALSIDQNDPSCMAVCAGAVGYKVRVLGIGPKET